MTPSRPESDQAKQDKRFSLAKARIGDRPWLPLDNASNIFLSTMTSVDTKVFRLTADLADPVQPDLLQKALDRAYDEFPLYHGIIRRGTFWPFIEKSPLRPRIELVQTLPCAQIYKTSYRGLLFRVLYLGNRIHLEVFHALSDGNGAMNFFQLLLIHYFQEVQLAQAQSSNMPLPYYVATDNDRDSFADHFAGLHPRDLPLPAQDQNPDLQKKSQKKGKVYHFSGPRTPDGRMQVHEWHLRTSKLLTTARAAGGTVTAYLSAIFMLALYDSIPAKQKAKKSWCISLSCPVDLRQFFPSLTSRNFFATILLRYTFAPQTPVSLPDLTAELGNQIKNQGTKEELGRKVLRFVRLENSLPLRILPLHLKDFILRSANLVNNRQITGSLTNLGRFRLPGEIGPRVEQINIMSSSIRPQFSAISYDNDFAIVFTSPLVDTQIQRSFRNLLLREGLQIHEAAKSVYTPDTPLAKAKKSSRKQDQIQSDPGLDAPNPNRDKTEEPSRPDLYPQIPLQADFSLASKILIIISILFIVGNGLTQQIRGTSLNPFIVIISLAALWLVLTGILRNRHNPAWLILWQNILLCGAVIAIDLLSGYKGWSLSYAVPAIHISSLIASEITLMVSRTALEHGILFMQLSCIFALFPGLFLLLGWVSPHWPSIVSVCAAVIAFFVSGIWHRKVLMEEVKRKLRF